MRTLTANANPPCSSLVDPREDTQHSSICSSARRFMSVFFSARSVGRLDSARAETNTENRFPGYRIHPALSGRRTWRNIDERSYWLSIFTA
jgi:hypothetical protein